MIKICQREHISETYINSGVSYVILSLVSDDNDLYEDITVEVSAAYTDYISLCDTNMVDLRYGKIEDAVFSSSISISTFGGLAGRQTEYPFVVKITDNQISNLSSILELSYKTTKAVKTK